MELNLSKRLSFLANSSNELDSPFDAPNIEAPPIVELPEEEQSPEERKRKYLSLFDSFDDPIEEEPSVKLDSRQEMIKTVKGLNSFTLEALADELDDYLSSPEYLDDEDIEFRNSLIGLGRQYARDTATTAEASEITKAFSGSRQKLKKLFDEVGKDKDLIGQDISRMREMRSRNFEALANLATTRKEFHNSQLNIIKEINAVTKAEFDLRAKEAARKKEEGAADSGITPNAIRDLFSNFDRKDLIGAVGGYSAITTTTDEVDDEILAAKYASSGNDEGDKFLQYENAGVHYILLLDENDVPQDVIAEDAEGNIVYDYPMPSGDLSERSFDIRKNTMTAEDDFHRTYKIRYV